jgi:hypothetical protein
LGFTPDEMAGGNLVVLSHPKELACALRRAGWASSAEKIPDGKASEMKDRTKEVTK